MSVSPRKSPVRESVTTIAEDGSRNFLRPADVHGRYTNWRRWVAALWVVVFVGLPWIEINGYPAVFIDIVPRRFHLFGVTLAAQDIWLFYFLVTGLGFTLFFVTALLGRVWCGWVCPQTVFMEHVFRRVERLLEGPAAHQKELDKLSWSHPDKLLRRGSKLVVFFLLSLAVVHVFMTYFVSVDGLKQMILDGPTQHWGGFIFMLVATLIIFFDFLWFREQMCLIICPYGRLQSVLTDDNSYAVGYDEIRGEPRGKPGKEGVGDCINCNRCVQVCPTGIDIRQGYQMECIGCMNCADACDEVMHKLSRAPGLINYAPANQRLRQPVQIFRPRIFLYLALMLGGLCVGGYTLSHYDSATISITRMVGMPFYLRGDTIQNQFNVRLINKSSQAQTFHIRVESTQPGLQMAGVEEALTVEAMNEFARPVILSVPKTQWKGRFEFTVYVEHGDQKTPLSCKGTFVGPDRIVE